MAKFCRRSSGPPQAPIGPHGVQMSFSLSLSTLPPAVISVLIVRIPFFNLPRFIFSGTSRRKGAVHAPAEGGGLADLGQSDHRVIVPGARLPRLPCSMIWRYRKAPLTPEVDWPSVRSIRKCCPRRV